MSRRQKLFIIFVPLLATYATTVIPVLANGVVGGG